MTLKHLTLDTKSADLSLDSDTGVFTGYASTFGNQDLDGDVVVKGAFTKTLSENYGGDGAGIPIHWEHSHASPFDIIGQTLSAVEDEKGLLITASIDLDNDAGRQVYDLLKAGLVHQMSIGFVPTETEWVTSENDGPYGGHQEFRAVKLFEISVVQIAANQQAEILQVKAGRAISKSNEDKLRAAYDSIGEVLSGIDSDNSKKPKQDTDDPESGDEGKKGSDAKTSELVTKAREILAGIHITEKE